MTQPFSLTGYDIQAVAGMYAQVPNKPQVHNAIFYSATSTDTIAAGTVVRLSTTSTNTLVPVVELDAAASAPYGVVVYDARVQNYAVNDRVALAQSGDIVYMQVGTSAIVVGDQVTVTEGNLATKSSSGTGIGTAITAGSANGIVQVQLSF